MIKPEQLKAVAEYMGYDVRLSELSQPVTANGKLCLRGTTVRYNPLQNSDQCLELMEKLKIMVCPNSQKIWFARCQFKTRGKAGKTINEAVTLAAIAYVEGLDNES